MKIKDVSRLIHDSLFRDTSQSLCARAYDKHRGSVFWRIWMHLFGPMHCARSYYFHRNRRQT